jgi:hypothetical protein
MSHIGGGDGWARMENRSSRRRMPPADESKSAPGDNWVTKSTGRHRAAQRHNQAAGPARAGSVRDRMASAGRRAAASDKRWSARTGAIIIATASALAAVLVIVILNFDAGAGARQRAQDAAIMAPVTGLGTLAHRYPAIAAPVNRQLATEIGDYNASENTDLAAARLALQAEVRTERSFGASLARWLASWQEDYAAAKALQVNGVADVDEPVIINIPYSFSVAGTAKALLTADQASESLISRQAQAATLLRMRLLNSAHQAANRAVEAQAALLRKELRLPPA